MNNTLNEEVLRIRQMMGLNENLNEFVDSVKIIDDGFGRMEPIIKGLSINNSARNDSWQENPTKAKEFVEAFNKLVTDFVESDQKYTGSIPTEPEEKKKYVISQIDQRIYGFMFNRGSGSFVRAYSDPYKTQVVRVLEKLTKELGLTYSNGKLNSFLNRMSEEPINEKIITAADVDWIQGGIGASADDFIAKAKESGIGKEGLLNYFETLVEKHYGLSENMDSPTVGI
jgi:hypothetical protein